MGSSAPRRWIDRSALRTDPGPYVGIHHVRVFVRDQDRSINFYVEQLGFDLLIDAQTDTVRWAAVAPPDGSALLAIIAPEPGSDEYDLIGRVKQVVLITEDVQATCDTWTARGVHFTSRPTLAPWGGTIAVFEDPDGNSFALVGFDEATREITARRRSATERLEAERRFAHELEIARAVQARLLPGHRPAMRTLEYAGTCVQAREVGGDYYDFLDLGQGRLALVVGDVAGKGIAAALLMANLQAHLRSHYVGARDDIAAMLASVNRLFFRTTPESSYATLFFGLYDDATSTLSYANCGHMAPLLIHSDTTVERLLPTSTVLGLFEESHVESHEVHLAPGDRLVLYTDGVVECCDTAGTEFGEARLLHALATAPPNHPQAAIEAVLAAVDAHGDGTRQDDLTLVIAHRL